MPDNGEMLVLGFNVNCCLFWVCLGFGFGFVRHCDCTYLWLPEEGDCLMAYVVVVVVSFVFSLLVCVAFCFLGERVVAFF